VEPLAESAAPLGSDPLPEQHRQALVALLRQQPRGAAKPASAQVQQLIEALERSSPADLAQPATLAQLEGVWELRWSSSSQPYLTVAPWLENLQLLAPAQGRGMNLLRLSGPLAPLAAIVVEASIGVEAPDSAHPAKPLQRVRVQFRRGGWLGPSLASRRLQLLREVRQPFPAWLDITVLDQELRVCRGNAGSLFALLRRPDLNLQELLGTELPERGG
jgi:hypothetical protein